MSKHLFSSLGVKYPIIQAPMAGGPSSPALVSAVSNAGGIGFLASGYLTAAAMEAQILAVQKLTDKPFGVNIFLSAVVQSTVVQKSPEIVALEDTIGLPKKDSAVTVAVDEEVDQKISLIVKYNVKIVSFTFGVPTAEQLNTLHAHNILTIGTACSITEALVLEKAGVKAVVLQGIEAGGHRGSFSASSDEIALLPLLQSAQAQLSIPYIASGGISTGRAILAAKVLGASAVQIGTAFILTHESGSSNSTKQALLAAKPEDTLVTAAISGKKARGVNNSLIQGLQNSHIEPYPIQNALTKELRGHAFKNSLTEYQSLWSGQGVDLVKELSASELISNLVAEYESAVKQDFGQFFGL